VTGPLSSRRVLRRALIPLAAFGAGIGIAELAGAADLGTAFGIGQIAFAIALVAVLLLP
jgi:hypothetical protein